MKLFDEFGDEVLKSRYTMEQALMKLAFGWTAMRSKDPRTKVGALVYDPESGDVFLGYNGFPPGVPDLTEVWNTRDKTELVNKHKLVVHAEANAIRKAWCSLGHDVKRCTLFVTHHPCHRCMVDFILPSKIQKVFWAIRDKEDPIADELILRSTIDFEQLEVDPTWV